MPYFRHVVTGPGSAGDVWVATMHSNSANTLAAVHTAWTALINNFFGGTYKALMSPQQSATGTRTDQLDPVTGRNAAQASSVIAQVGTGGGATPSPRSCMVISFGSALPTREGRGRLFLPAPDMSHWDNTGKFLAAATAAVSVAFANEITTFKATSQPVIYHRSTRTGTNITSVKVGQIVGTQRRRTNKDAQSYSQTPV